MLTLAALIAALAPSAAHAVAWTADAGTKLSPHSLADDRTTLDLYAAGDEYEGGQIAVRGSSSRTVSLSWAPGSSPLLTEQTSLHRVGYVTIRRPSTGTKARAGEYPDPLLPAEFDQDLTVPAGTTSFYLLVHVPRGTDAGEYVGVVNVREGSSTSAVTVRLHVYAFDLPRQRVPALLAINQQNVRASVRGAIPWTHENQARVLSKYYDFYKRYGFSPGVLLPSAWVRKADGELTNRESYRDFIARWLNDDTSGPGHAVTRLSWSNKWPWRLSRPTEHRAQQIAYLANLCKLFKQSGWQDKLYAFPVDEPSPGAAERRAEAYARILHAASAKAGFRAKYLLTSEPRPRRFKGRPANTFLFDDVDIWATRVYRFWDWLGPLRERQRAGKQIWMYTYSFNPQARKAPTFLIDEPLADEHAIFWMMWRWNADGMLYWRANKWSTALGGGYRNPFLDPLSFRSKNGSLVFNGEASLLYPGYEPRLGLRNPYAGPLSSLRFEALRDGIEEHTYLQVASRLGDLGAPGRQVRGLAQRLAEELTYYASGAYPWNWTNIPLFNGDAGAYAGAKRRLGEAIENARAGRGLNVVTGRVLNEAGAPIRGATVSDGVLRTTTAADGSFSLQGVLTDCRLQASHPLYQASYASGSAGGPAVELRLRRSSARLITSFEARGSVVLRGAAAKSSRTVATDGSRALRVTLRGRGAELTYHFPRQARNLRWAEQLELDVFNPGGMNWTNPWKLILVLYDTHGGRTWERYILKPRDWTHISLTLPRKHFDAGNVSRLIVKATSDSARTVYLDGLLAR